MWVGSRPLGRGQPAVLAHGMQSDLANENVFARRSSHPQCISHIRSELSATLAEPEPGDVVIVA